MAAIDSHDESETRFSLIELDLPTSAAPPTPRAAPAPTPAPAPTATPLETGRALLLGATNEAALNAAVERLVKTYPDASHPTRLALRPVYRMAVLAITWLRLWASLTRAVRERPALVTPLVPTVEAIAAQPHHGTFARRSSSDAWHGFLPFSGRAVRPGDRIVLTRRNGATQAYYVGELLHTNYRVQGQAGTLVSFTDAAPVAAPVAAPAAALDAPAPVASDASTIGGALGDIAAASAAPRPTSGSLADGTMRGVGFSSADGYVQALANGTKRATADMYLSTLRAQYHYTPEQIAALTVTIIAESSLPVGAGITHTPAAGRSVADMTRAEARAHFQQQSPAAQAKIKAAAELHIAEEHAGELQSLAIAGLVAEGDGLIVSGGHAQRGVVVPRADVVAALDAIGRAELAPRVKTSKAQFGEVMGRLGGGALHARAAKKRNSTDWPADVSARWIVSRLDDAATLGSAGDKELIAELIEVDSGAEVRFVGGSTELRERVVAAFAERTGAQTYNPGDLHDWLRYRVLQHTYSAVEYGGFWWAPGGQARKDEIRTVINAVLPLMGRVIAIGEAANKASMSGGITDTLRAEIATVRAAYERNVAAVAKAASEKAAKEGLGLADQELAARRASITSDVAANRLRDLDKVAIRVAGFAELLGPALHAPLRTAVDELRTTLAASLDDVSQRFAMLELV
jgi:hypothetical protein